MAIAALVVVGLILVVIGILAGASYPLIGLGVLSLIAAGVLQVLPVRKGG